MESCLLPPFANSLLGNAEFRSDCFRGLALVGEQGNPGAQDLPLRTSRLPDDRFQKSWILGRKVNMKSRATASHAIRWSGPNYLFKLFKGHRTSTTVLKKYGIIVK
jgi:hypothetical protein